MNSSAHCRGAGMRRTPRRDFLNVLVGLLVALIVWPSGVGSCADPAQAAVAPETKADFTPQARPAGAKTATTGSEITIAGTIDSASSTRGCSRAWTGRNTKYAFK